MTLITARRPAAGVNAIKSQRTAFEDYIRQPAAIRRAKTNAIKPRRWFVRCPFTIGVRALLSFHRNNSRHAVPNSRIVEKHTLPGVEQREK